MSDKIVSLPDLPEKPSKLEVEENEEKIMKFIGEATKGVQKLLFPDNSSEQSFWKKIIL